MDTLKYFLDETCKESKYRYERVGTLAEIYSEEDAVPVATVEYQRSIGMMVIHFRIGLELSAVGHLTMRMTLADSSLVFENDFFIHEEFGYLYGDEARQAFIDRLKANMHNAQIQNVDDAFFVSHQPLVAYGSDVRTKFERMWDEE